ncbi:hypothetical protein K2173_025103 [Erythroxylum novogranatense]|uniref:Peptide chain release factor domain-containing protein n=1 Tax=Erythroxylum novogranatense TaxID=1862640 RepID=A0AAV8SVG0_9ROSI|nr:hypothetical protein K2173_025103 [Erythroxylum novogranatense]
MAAEAGFLTRAATIYSKSQAFKGKHGCSPSKLLLLSKTRASHSIDDKNEVFKQLGLFSLKKKIEDAVIRAEILAAPALELEEARRIKQEETIRQCDLWDDLAKSNEILVKLADSAKVVDALKDLRYKAEEAKLISQLAEMEAINYQLFKQAYSASVDVSTFLDQYEMLRLLKGPYDKEGACVIIQAGSRGTYPQMWIEELLSMYIKWAERIGYKSSLVEKNPRHGSVQTVTIELEFECAYGYLLGEKGLHNMVESISGSFEHKVISAYVDVIPLSLNTTLDLQIKDEDLIVSPPSLVEQAVSLKHIPTGITIHSSGQRSYFANKAKALSRLKAKLLVIAKEQSASDITCIRREAIADGLKEARRYISCPYKLVEDVKTGLQLPDLSSVLEGNIEPLIAAHINLRRTE